MLTKIEAAVHRETSHAPVGFDRQTWRERKIATENCVLVGFDRRTCDRMAVGATTN